LLKLKNLVRSMVDHL